MEFDSSAFRHPMSVAEWDAAEFDVFVRCDDGSIEHYWSGDGVVFGPEPLGGSFTTDPVAVWEFFVGEWILHLVGRSGAQLVDWRWIRSGPGGFLGVPTVEALEGYCVTDPEVVHFNRLSIFASTLDGQLRHWALGPEGWTGPETVGAGGPRSKPTAISRAPGVIDVFACSGGLSHWWLGDDGWHFESRGGERLIGQPAVASSRPDRLDVFVVNSDGVPVHWGWDNGRWFGPETRLQMTFGLSSSVVATPEISLVSYGPNLLSLIGRSTDDQLVEWRLRAPDGWSGANPFDRIEHPAVAWSPEDNRVDVLSRNNDGSFTHDVFVVDPSGGMGEPVPGGFESELLVLAEPEPPPRTLTMTPVDADLLVTRPSDLVVLGLRWTGFEVQTPAGAPAELSAGAGAELTAIFPPQHIVEEVLDAGAPGSPTRSAALSGPSRVVVGLPAGVRVPLSVEGVLDALRHGQVVPSLGASDEKTAIEIPYHLVISPTAANAVDMQCTHDAEVVAGPTGSVGMWQTAIAAAGTPARAAAGLVLRALDAGSADPFPVALSGGFRGRIMLEAPTARIDRLALSALGGTLFAVGSWDTFEWEHVAALGRDRRVRTSTKGVLYPFGHRAEYVETTERVFETAAEGATAHLRKSRTLRVSEPVRAEPADAALRAAFPFADVEFERLSFENLDEPGWEIKEFPTPERDRLEMALAQWETVAQPIYEAIYGDMGPFDDPPVEDLAFGLGDAADLLDPDDPDSGTRGAAALEYLSTYMEMEWIRAQIDALPHGGVAPLDVYFAPMSGGQAVLFPLRLAGRVADVHLALPLIFVADVDRSRALLNDEFHSLSDGDIARRVAQSYRAGGDGVVDVGGARIDLVRSPTPMAADVCEVQRLHIVGQAHEGGFRPRLGVEPAPDEQDLPAADRWGFDVVLPAVRTLLGADQPPLRLALSRALLGQTAGVDIPFQVPDEAAKLATDFAKNSSRSGGIVAPDIVADGISRAYGPVRVAAFSAGPEATLDPQKVLGDTATLLGYRLADLIDATALQKPPAIMRPDPASPEVTLQWRGVTLGTDKGSFVTAANSTLDLDVVVGVADQKITCTVEHIALALPDRTTKLIEVTFEKVVFTQEANQPPTLRLDGGVDAEFFGILNLLKKLQDAVDIGDSAPQIEASSRGVSASYTVPVPDVTAGAFQMTGLVFHAGIDVPFDEKPVTISLAFASREKPFNLSVLMFGGGGYVDVEIDRTGLRRLELALEFGASVSVNFVVAFGEVHALGGVSIVKAEQFGMAGYLRFGGHVSVFGLISVSVELTLTLRYDFDTNEMIGRATLVLEVDLTLISESVELDTGDWVLVGGTNAAERISARPEFAIAHPLPLDAASVPDEWVRYRSAFAPDSVRT